MRPHTPFEGLRINLHGISQALKQEMLWGMKAVHMDFSQTLFAISHEIRPIKFKFLNNKTECLAWKSSQ